LKAVTCFVWAALAWVAFVSAALMAAGVSGFFFFAARSVSAFFTFAKAVSTAVCAVICFFCSVACWVVNCVTFVRACAVAAAAVLIIGSPL